MKYLVLGSEGQIGKYLTDFLRDKGEEVVEHDIKRNRYEDMRKASAELECKIMDSEFVFFFAWDVGGSKYLEKREGTFDFIHNNMSIMKYTFEYLKKYDKPFIFASSQMALILHSSYGNLKLVGEKYVKSLNGLSVRLWNVYGEEKEKEKEKEKAHVITDFIEMAKTKGVISARTTGEEERQFLHVNDCSEVLYFLSQNYEKFRKEICIDISSFEWIKIKDVAKQIANIFDCKFVMGGKKDNIQGGEKREPNSFILKYWNPKISLEDGIKRILNHK